MNDGSEVKKSKGKNIYIIKQETIFENYKNCLFNVEVISKQQERFKSDHHKVYTENINKTALSSDDDKRLQTFNRVTRYPYGALAIEVCESEMMVVKDLFVKKYVDCPFYGEIVLKQ